MANKRDREHQLSRRALIRWSLAAGAALGVSRSRIFDVLERSAGRGVAEAASAITTRRSVHIRAGTGGLAWFQLMWPHNDIAAARSDVFAWHAPGAERELAGTSRRLTVGPQTPFAGIGGFTALPPERQVTAIMAGVNETHTNNPDSIIRSLDGSSMFAVAAALQTTNPSVVPVITVDDVMFGSAPGAPRASVVPTGADIVGLFNSAASRAGGLLADPTNAEVFRAHYAALAGLDRAADRSTNLESYATGRSAARFVGVNLAARLAITDGDLAAYGVDATTPPDVAELARTLIVTAKAFQMGLTQSVIAPGPRDDPHGAFDNGIPLLVTKLAALQRVLDAFMADLATRIDDTTGTALAGDVVITIDGDTPKTPMNRVSWLDPTPGNSNWIYVLGAGALRTGWFGGIATDASVTGFDPATGDPTPTPDTAAQARAAVGAVAYAIAKSSARRVEDFTTAEYAGLING